METLQQSNNCHEVGDKGVVKNGLEKQKTIPLPLEVGTKIMCQWRDGKLHPAKVIEWRKLSTGLDDYQYYVHYDEFKRRLDDQVKLDQLEFEFVEEDAGIEKVKEKVSELRMTRHQKQKIEETHVEEEHEELTKVKNINKIELWRYEIDAWYFSPFPAEYRDCSQLFFCELCFTFLK